MTELELGEVIGECMPRHRAKEFLRFLKKIDKLGSLLLTSAAIVNAATIASCICATR